MKCINLKARMQKKQLIYVFAVIGLASLAGCYTNANSTSKKESTPPILLGESNSTDESEANKALVLKMYKEFDKGALPDFAEHISDDFKCNVLGNIDLDWDGFIQFGNGFLSAFPDGKHNFDYVIVNGENVVTIGIYTGTHLKEMQGIAPTHAKIKLPVMHLDRVVEGKIVEHRGIANQVQLMNQLGITMVPKN